MKPVLHLGIRPERFPDGFVDQVRRETDGYEIAVTQDPDAVKELLPRIEITLGSFPRKLLPEARALRWYQQGAAGADWMRNHPEIQELEFALTSASGVHAVPISEHMMAFLLAFARGFAAPIRQQRERVWEENRNQPLFELPGLRVLILGVGAIGARFARLCKAHEMEVVGMRRDPSRSVADVDRIVGMEALHEELPGADVIANTLPLTSETHQVIGEAEFNLMKRTAILINIGRGATMDEAALVKALRDKRIRGAGLDVFDEEPLPESSRLWELENVILTPHYSGLTPRYNDRVAEIFLDNLRRYLSGEPLRNLVDKKLGY